MAHYICKGGNCKTVSDIPGVCVEPLCKNRYALLEECNCPHKKYHYQTFEANDGRHKRKRRNALYVGAASGALFGSVLATFIFLIPPFSEWLKEISYVLSVGYAVIYILVALLGVSIGFLIGTIAAFATLLFFVRN